MNYNLFHSMHMLSIVVTILLLWPCVADEGLGKLVIIILNQNLPYHARHATVTKQLIISRCSALNVSPPVVHLGHEDFPGLQYWTVFPALPILSEKHGQNASWFLFATDALHVEPTTMLATLSRYSPEEELLLGRALRDRQPTIIHHFAFHEDPSQFAFPDLSAGVLMSSVLLNSLSRRYQRLAGAPVDFSIDPAHELALFVWHDGAGVALSDPGTLCATEAAGCACWPLPPPPCAAPVEPDALHVAVKTCSRFHDQRLPVVRDTWARHAPNVRLYSDLADDAFGTIAVGVPNTERGHCAKTLRILQLSATIPGLQWLAVVDDDTLISIPRLRALLGCYDPTQPLLLGERYGFRTSGRSGYNYITGGGGMVLSAAAVRRLVDCPHCRCPSADTPDDMHLGMCAPAAGVSLLHSPLFHQARPPDYPPELLAGTKPISFHKHWNVDPRRVYRSWLHDAVDTDTARPAESPSHAEPPPHTEL